MSDNLQSRGAAATPPQDDPAPSAQEDFDAPIEDGAHPIFRGAPSSGVFNKLRKRLVRQVRETIADYGMLPSETARPARRPRWLVCVSGGKDSYAMLALLLDLQWRGLLPVDLLACNLDQGQPGFPKEVLPTFLSGVGVPHRIERQDTYSVVIDKVPAQKTYCALCSRLRRGHLYRVAREERCDAILLGHHLDDALETFFLNLFHGGRLASMPPKLLNEEGDLLVLRPLSQSSEADLARFARAMAFPIIPCDLCGSQDGLQRQAIKRLLADWERASPGRKGVMRRALAHVRPSHLLDPKLFDFAALTPNALTPNACAPNICAPSPGGDALRRSDED